MGSMLMKGVIRNGQVVVDEPIDLPDGSKVFVQLLNGDLDAEAEEGWDNSPSAMAAWVEWCDALQPLTITALEEADADAWLRKTSELGNANMVKGIEGLFP